MDKNLILTLKCIWCGKEIDIREGEPTPYCPCMFAKRREEVEKIYDAVDYKLRDQERETNEARRNAEENS